MQLLKVLSAIVIIILLFIIVLTVIVHKPQLPISNISQKQNESINTSKFNLTVINSNSTIVKNDTSANLNTEPVPVSSNIIFNNINWSKYQTIEKIRVHDNFIAEPNDVINHTFIVFEIDVSVKDPENTQELYRELAGISVEMRQMIGQDSSINVWGLVNGIDSYHVGMLPYEDQIYAIDHYHPFAYKNDIYLIPGDDIYDYHSYTLVNNSVIEP